MDLIDASNNSDIKRVQELLDSREDVNFIDDEGDTALMMATIRRQPDIVQLLLENGADPNIQSNYGETPLMSASYRSYRPGSTDIVKLLLKNGANPNIRDIEGSTALMLVSIEGKINLAELLLKNGANPNIKKDDGDTALSFAVTGGHADIVELLERHIKSVKIQKASQQLQASRLSTEYEPSRIIAKHLSKMPYNPDVSRRMQMERDENDENDRTSHYLNTLYEGGKKKKRKKKRKKEKKMRGGMTDNEEIINQLKLINTKLDLCCPKNYDQATRNIQRVYRGHKDRNTFKQKRRSMKPNVTDSLLDMPTDFGSMIMDKIPEVMEERREKHIERGREQRRAAQREGDIEIADIRRAVREGTVNWEDVGISAAEWAKIEEIAEEYSWDEDSDIYNLLVEFRYDNANPQSLLVQGYERRNGMWRMPNE